MMLGYVYYRVAGEAYALVSIGLVSFAAVAQFAPAMLGGMYWKRRHAQRRARRSRRRLHGLGLHAAAAVVREVGLAADRVRGPGAVRHRAAEAAAALRPGGPRRRSAHSLFWSMLVNVGAYVAFSLARPAERTRACAGAAVRRRVQGGGRKTSALWRGSASVHAVAGRSSAASSVRQRAEEAFAAYAPGGAASPRTSRCRPMPRLVHFVEIAAGRRDRRRVGARHGRVGGAGRAARHRRGARHPRRGLAGDRVQPPARAEVARARSRDRRAARGQRAADRSSTA